MSKKLPNGLTVQQDDFARAVAKGMSQTDAAIAAGYAKRSAAVTGSQLIRNPKIAALIDSLRNKVAAKCEIDIAFVLNGLRENALRCQTAVPVLDETGEPIGEYRFDASGSNRAFELLGKHLGAFIDRTQIDLSTDARMHIQAVAQSVVKIVMEECDRETARRITDRIANMLR